MNGRELSAEECEKLIPGEALALTAIMAILAISIITVVVYRLLKSSEGSAKLPGGWAFSWE